jgi:thiamine-phosphate pyrophosphorylase
VRDDIGLLTTSVTGDERRARLADARLYLCTDARTRQGDLREFLDAVLAGGVDVVQLRDKTLEAREELAAAAVFAEAARRHGALFSINDRADVAYAVKPDILHLGQLDLPVEIARELLGGEVLIGRSTHATADVDTAVEQDGVDYLCVGPTWATPTKPGRPAAGEGLIRYAAASGTRRPWFAIGGIGTENLDVVLKAGATRVVVVRAITEAADPGQVAAALAGRLRS